MNFLQISVKNCFIRGSVVRYVHLPPEHVDTALLQDATRKEVRGVSSARSQIGVLFSSRASVSINTLADPPIYFVFTN